MNQGSLVMGRPETVGVSNEALESAFRVISREVEQGSLPGAVAVVGRKSQVIGLRAYGWAQMYAQKRLMQVDTLFDLASLTKVVATLPSVLRLIDQGYIRLDDKLKTFVPEYVSEEVKIRHLLCHTSGLMPHRKFWEESLLGDELIKAVLAAAPEYTPGTKVVYSDLGFILLGVLVERITGLDIAAYAKKHIFAPLGMMDTGFVPPPELAQRAAATEFRKDLDKFMIGEVHDENAHAMGGVAGHAGLFSTAHDLSVFCQMLLSQGTYRGTRVLSPAVVRASELCHTQGKEDRRGLGWLLKSSENSLAGDLLPDSTFFHTGFTGTAIWIDRSHELFIILLTNRVHPTRDNEVMVRLRPRFCNAVAASIKDWGDGLCSTPMT
jgi:CubicO group peptidase (beta-lactamase class C family)